MKKNEPVPVFSVTVPLNWMFKDGNAIRHVYTWTQELLESDVVAYRVDHEVQVAEGTNVEPPADKVISKSESIRLHESNPTHRIVIGMIQRLLQQFPRS